MSPDIPIELALLKEEKNMQRRLSIQRTPRVTPRIATVAAVLAMEGAALIATAQSTDEKITHTVNGNTETWRIDKPSVKKPGTEYRQIKFQPGDRITIQADGCVQTGGIGDTWKRYVNPSGDNTEQFYHGLIQIPGATAGLVRFAAITRAIGPANKAWQGTLSIPRNFVSPSGLFLRLGYEDNGYSDNGYYDHDNGNNDQCKTKSDTNGGAALVTLMIEHGAPTPPPTQGCTTPYDLDLANTAWDLNGIPLNPRWCPQDDPQRPTLPSQTGAAPGDCSTPWTTPCTTQSPQIIQLPDWYEIDPYDQLAKTCAASGPLGMHVNWGLVTYEGQAKWDSWSQPSDISLDPRHPDWPDDDYNINVVRQDQAAYTKQNPDNLHTEFDSDETIDNFNTTWWNRIHDAVKNDTVSSLINNHEIIEIGELGLDCAHSCGSEIHPVLAMAIHVQENLSDDVWAIFARNSGDEGFCGHVSIVHPELSTIYLKLPWPDGAAPVAPAVRDATNWQKTAIGGGNQITITTFPMIPGPQVRPSSGFVVRIDLGDANAFPIVNGELHLQWSQQPTTIGSARARLGVFDRARVATSLIRQPPVTALEPPLAAPEPEAAFAKKYAGLSTTTREKLKQALVSKSIRPSWVAVKATNLHQAPTGFVAEPRIAVRALHKGRVMHNLRKKDLYGRAGTVLKSSP